jgi:MFS family permease
MVQQVTVIAILMIVQGALEAAMGLLYLALGPAMIWFGMQPGGGPPGPQEQTMAMVVSVVYVCLGLVTLVAGVLNVWAGIRNLNYRGRTLGMVALISGTVSVFTCYCAPTAIALLVYGLIVYLSDDVKHAFALGEEGKSADQVRAQFERRVRQYDDFDEEVPGQHP